MAFVGVAAQVADKMMLDPQGAGQLAFAREMSQDPDWKWLTDAFGQPYEGWTPGQLAYLYRLYEFWAMGELAVTRLPVGCGPYSDRQREANQAALNTLARIEGPELSAWVDPDQKTSPYGDGWLTWQKEIILGIRDARDPDTTAEAWAYVDGLNPNRTVPLEIGYTDTMTTYAHVLQGIGVARWAYDSDRVVLMVSSTFVREAELAADPTVRWKPKQMWTPSDEWRPETVGAAR